MKELILRNELEKVQRVLDISVKAIGEERTLYDTAYCFLSMGKSEQAEKLLGTIQNTNVLQTYW